MEPEGSLPHSHDPPISFFRDPDQASPCPPSQYLKIHYAYIYTYVFQVVSSPRGFLPKRWMYHSCPLYMPHAPPISFFSIWSP